MNTKSTIRIIGLFGVVILTMACELGLPTAQPQTDKVGTVVAATMQALTAVSTQSAPTETVPPAQSNGTPFSFKNVSFMIPDGLAGGATAQAVPAVSADNGAPWEIGPAHLEFTLTGYRLQDKFHEPQIYIIPADEYASSNEGAAKSIADLKQGSNIQWTSDTLPRISFFNAAQVFAAQIQPIQFQSGSGVRFLTEYAQNFTSINNQYLFYQFQGLTNDGKDYLVAILPITAPMLAPDEKPDSPVPPEGIPFPGYETPTSDFNAYLNAVTDKLNATSADSFQPSINQLDALIQSIQVSP